MEKECWGCKKRKEGKILNAMLWRLADENEALDRDIARKISNELWNFHSMWRLFKGI